MTLAAHRIDPLPKVSTAWFPFIGALAGVLAGLLEDQFLILTAKGSNRFVQFYAQGTFGMRIEAVSNEFLSGLDRLDEAQLARLDELGWQRPSGCSRMSTPQSDPDGSPNHYIDFRHPLPYGEVAAVAARTLREAMAVPHPQFLEYTALDTRGNALEFPTLGLMRSAPADRRAWLERRVLGTLEALTGLGNLGFNDGGVVGLRHGACAILIRPSRDESAIVIDAPLLVGVEASSALLAELNALNAGDGRLRFSFDGDTVNARCDVAVEAFTPMLFGPVLDEFCAQCEAVADLLQASFGGRTALAGRSSLRPMPPLSRLHH